MSDTLQPSNLETDPDARGVYGLRLDGADLGDAVPGGVPAAWPCVRVSVEPAGDALPEACHDDDRCVLPLADEERTLVCDRAAGTATFLGPGLAPDDLAHPYLGPVATIFARWHGREAFHAGGFVEGGKAFAVLGQKEAGKSTLVAALAAAGVPVVADDLLVIGDGHVYRGPRTIDLRAEPAAWLRGDANVTLARGGERWRVALPPIAAAVPLGGWIFLSSGDQLEIRPVPFAERLERVASRRSWRMRPSDPSAVLDLAALPGWDVQAPRRWDALPATIDALRTLAR